MNEVAEALGVEVMVHRVNVGAGPNLEARARAARLGALSVGAATGHTADEATEVQLLNVPCCVQYCVQDAPELAYV